MQRSGNMDARWWLVLIIFPTCSLSGLAALLRSNQPLTYRAIASAALNSGFFGVAVACLLIHYFGASALHITLGVSVLAGLGGNAALDFVLELLKSYVRSKTNGRTN